MRLLRPAAAGADHVRRQVGRSPLFFTVPEYEAWAVDLLARLNAAHPGPGNWVPYVISYECVRVGDCFVKRHVLQPAFGGGQGG